MVGSHGMTKTSTLGCICGRIQTVRQVNNAVRMLLSKIRRSTTSENHWQSWRHWSTEITLTPNAGSLRSLQLRFTYSCRQTFLLKAENLRNAKTKFAAQWKVGHRFSLIMQYLFLAINASCILIGNYLRTLCCVLLSFHFFFFPRKVQKSIYRLTHLENKHDA